MPASTAARPARATRPPELVRLREFVRERAENRPGVYRMRGAGEEILYVGKSIRVRTRLLSYFRAKPGEKAAKLMRATRRIEWEDTADEFSAILTEMKLIQRYRPPFNVEHKRKRRFTFAKLTAEAAPRLVLVGRIQADGGRYFGPFPSSGRIHEALRELSLVLGLRSCAGPTPIHFGDQIELLGTARAPLCLRAELGSCPAPCAGGCSEREYLERVRQARRFLDGAGREAFEMLEVRMREAAERHEFEYAALLRDRAGRLQRLQEELVAFRGRVASLSFVYRPPVYDGPQRLYLIRRGRILATLTHPRGRRQRQRAARAVETAWKRPEREADLRELRPDDAAEIFLIANWFRRHPEEWARTEPAEDFIRRISPPFPAVPRKTSTRVPSGESSRTRAS